MRSHIVLLYIGIEHMLFTLQKQSQHFTLHGEEKKANHATLLFYLLDWLGRRMSTIYQNEKQKPNNNKLLEMKWTSELCVSARVQFTIDMNIWA